MIRLHDVAKEQLHHVSAEVLLDDHPHHGDVLRVLGKIVCRHNPAFLPELVRQLEDRESRVLQTKCNERKGFLFVNDLKLARIVQLFGEVAAVFIMFVMISA